MTTQQPKKLVNFLTKEWGIYSSLNLNTIVDKLYNSISRPYSNFNTFESSLVSSERKVRLLHLDFYKPNSSLRLIKTLRKQRIESIVDIIKDVSANSGCLYNLVVLSYAVSLIDDTRWPIQFGYELDINAPPIIKVYFSPVDDNKYCNYLIQKMCAALGLRWHRLKKYFSNSEFDAFGIDFLHSGYCRIKIYPLYRSPFDLLTIQKIYQKYHKHDSLYLPMYLSWIKRMPLRHIGFLYRIAKNSTINSVKIWSRLDTTKPFFQLPFSKDCRSQKLKEWVASSEDTIKSVQGKISYVTLENKKLGVYFR